MSCDVCSEKSGAVSRRDFLKDGPFCSHCGALLPLSGEVSPFELFGLPECFDVDLNALSKRHLELSRRLHPDRFASAPQSERLKALSWTTALNGAFRTLSSPEARADFLLKRAGIDLSAETGAAAQERLPEEFLESALEEREALFEAEAEGDHEKAEALSAGIRRRMASHREELAHAFARALAAESTGSSGEKARALEEAASLLARLRYDARFLEEADRFEMEELE